MTRRSFTGVAALSSAAALAGCAGSGGQGSAGSEANEGSAQKPGGSGETASSSLTLCLDFTPNTNHTGIYVAKNQGWYDEEGIDLTIIQPGDGTAEALVGAKAAEFGVSYQDYLAGAFDSGNNSIVSIAALVQHNTSGIMSRKEDGIDSPSKMEGHNYATWQMPVELAMVKQVVEQDGGDFSKIELVPCEFDDGVMALKTNLCDSVWEYEGWAVQRANLEGVDVGWFRFIDINPVFDYYTPVLIVNIDYASENPELVRAFLRATAKGYQYAIEHPKEAAAMLVEEVPEIEQELAEASLSYLAGQFQAEVEQWGYVDPARWSAFFEWLNENDLVSKPLDTAAGYTNDYLPA